ncbi:hypothetical protein KOR34_29880 [Posidoniimonas corsicana]|uniref:Type II secretion system protein G n=1 Tax=Posidoniimonas corsicana TaxID=1938618 RepID=A0A5C5VJB9_9BACT|nr:type II secretion system protein [Posidoniimonas corsicana]TWT38020.1 hypothetical protein KOR34_29880 [Posidoniimonas corsicana]
MNHSGGTIRRTGFTLVELLVTMAIIAILASMLLGASTLAMNTARVSRTESLVTRLHTLLSQHYDSFRHRRVELNDATLAAVASSTNRNELAKARLFATREQLKMDLPDRWSDITLLPVTALTQYPQNAAANPTYLRQRSAMSSMFLRRYNRSIQSLQDSGGSVEDLLANQGAECLYLIVMLACGDGEAAGLFKETDIGDTDGDGAPEFIDSWGNPIEFIRWAPGFDSDVQLSYAGLDRIASNPAMMATEETPSPTPEQAVQLAVSRDHDPFDLFRVDTFAAGDVPSGFRLLPLIYSAGPDQEYGLIHPQVFVNVNSDPYVDTDGGAGAPYEYFGAIAERSESTDNIHNHLITGR